MFFSYQKWTCLYLQSEQVERAAEFKPRPLVLSVMLAKEDNRLLKI